MASRFRIGRLSMIVVFAAAQGLLAQSANVSVFASGFNNPRGLKWGPDGYLYVAEGGAGGSLSTVGLCDQAAGPPAGPGPYTGGFTGRISKVAANGAVSTVAEGLPSSQTSPAFGNLVSGVADVAFVRGSLYALLSGAGCLTWPEGHKERRDPSQFGWDLDRDRQSECFPETPSDREFRA